MKIGIYLAYDPNVVLKKEGLGRYLANLLKGFAEKGHSVSIACPEWMLEAMDALLDEYNLDSNKYNFLVSYKRPAVWTIYNWLRGKKRDKKKKLLRDWKIYRKLCGGVQSILSFLVSITSMSLFISMVAVIFLLCLLLLPLMVALGIVGFIVVISRNLLKKTGKLFDIGFIKRIISDSRIIEVVEKFAYDKMLKNAEQDLVCQINRKYKGQVDIWYCPAAFWSSFGDIQEVTVLNVPDLVTSEFCNQYAQNSVFVQANERVKRTIEKGKYFITYSEFVKQTLLEHQFGIQSCRIISIPHSVNQLERYITFDRQLAEKFGKDEDYSTVFSRNILNTLFVQSPNMKQYLRRFNFRDVKYIFYSSQVRPHKNMMTLVKAYEYLLRRKYCNVKLIVTGDLSQSKELWEYITEKRLQFDILIFYNVSVQELAALYRCATLVVNPTLYEGGFPFTFGEGMSVGTPSIMSDIPQVREVVAAYGLEENMLFDPYDYRALADKLEYGLKHRKELYERELPLYDHLSKRTQGIVCQEYVEAFQHFINLEKEK